MDTTLYDNLSKLPSLSEAFYFKDYEVNNSVYRVFNYRLASYSDFLHPDALEARGITFLIKQGGEELEEPIIVSRPFKKFFNLYETPFTMGLPLGEPGYIDSIYDKADGSLISTYFNPLTEEFGLKSKQDFFSEQSKMANEFINREENKELKDDLRFWACRGTHTVMLELISPLNYIVLQYLKTELRVIGIRDNFSGELIQLNPYAILSKYWVKKYHEKDPVSFLANLPKQTGIEGCVCTTKNGLMFKVKTDWYCALHQLKDSVTNPKALFEAIILETADDLRSMFHDSEEMLGIITRMEERVIPIYNHIISVVTKFHEVNKYLDRKDFAIKAQAELGNLFSLAMTKYLGKEVDFKAFALKRREEVFGVRGDENFGVSIDE
jgi:T4 RnlA family RNA ligase